MLLNTRKKQLNLFIGREYLLSFIVSFVFFFFIFFINQILLLARRILLSNVDFFTMLNLVVLAIPQFLLYTFPFSSLSASAMVIGNLNSTNELLALRSCGFSLKDIFKPILLLALVISLLCFTVADILLPLSSNRYQQLYVELLTKTPGVELKSNSSNVFDDFLITNGEVKDNIINDIVLIADESNSSYLINSEKGELNYLDINNLIYSLELNNPTLLVTEKNNDTYQYANSSKLTYFIDFSSSLKSINSNLPSNLSSVDLMTKIKENEKNLDSKIIDSKINQYYTVSNLNKNYYINKNANNININNFVDDYYYLPQINLRPIDFYFQYFRAEFNKKFALSAACFFLILITIPFANFKFKHGKLIGFGFSMFIAVLYWYLLFIAQLRTFSTALNPAILMWAPNLLILIISIVLIRLWRN